MTRACASSLDLRSLLIRLYTVGAYAYSAEPCKPDLRAPILGEVAVEPQTK